VERPAARSLGDLLAATEAVGHDPYVLRRLAHGRQQHLFADFHRHVVVLPGFEAERAGHAAAARIDHLDVKAEIAEDFLRIAQLEDRLLVAMPVDDRLAVEPRQRDVIGFLRQELAQQERLAAQALRILILRKEIGQLVAEDGDAARLEPDDRRAGADVVPQGVEDLAELAPCEAEHAEVVERAAAAERLRGNGNVIAGGLQDLDGRLRRLRMEIVVEGVRPEQDAFLL